MGLTAADTFSHESQLGSLFCCDRAARKPSERRTFPAELRSKGDQLERPSRNASSPGTPCPADVEGLIRDLLPAG